MLAVIVFLLLYFCCLTYIVDEIITKLSVLVGVRAPVVVGLVGVGVVALALEDEPITEKSHKAKADRLRQTDQK